MRGGAFWYILAIIMAGIALFCLIWAYSLFIIWTITAHDAAVQSCIQYDILHNCSGCCAV
jgi:hypothetical protein